MDKKKVFISSVINGFAAERDAAAEAIETLRHYPIRAEQFGARAETPQSACLGGVESSDVYVGIFGREYGQRVESGLSPTEEEFRHAEKLGLPLLCFVSSGELSPDQKQFIKSIGDYNSGITWVKYDSPSQLQKLVTMALNDHQANHSKNAIDAHQAAQQLTAAFEKFNEYGKHAPQLRIGMLPVTQAEYLAPGILCDEEFIERLEQALIYGPTPRLFDKSGVTRDEGDISITFLQGREHEPALRSLTIRNDGCLIYFCSLETQRKQRWSHGSSLADIYLLDQNLVAQQIDGFLAYVNQAFTTQKELRSIGNKYMWTQLAFVGNKRLGILPDHPINSISGMTQTPDIMSFPDQPQIFTAKQLAAGKQLADELVLRMVRKFKSLEAYWNAS